MADPIIVPSINDFLIEDEKASILLHTWMEAVTNTVNNLAPLTGTGTPEGNEVASVGRWYVDTSAAAGTGIYFKETGDGNTGWVLKS